MPETSLRFQEFELRTASYELRHAGQAIKLERIPMELLLLLIERRGDLVSREAIIQKLWGDGVFLDTEHSINTAISKLRTVLGDSAKSPVYIQTVVGKGYRFIAPVETVSLPELRNGSVDAAGPLPLDEGQAAPESGGASTLPEMLNPVAPLSEVAAPPRPRGRARAWFLAAFAAVLLAVGVYSLHVWRSRRESAKVIASSPKYQSVAVLPFLNLSPNPDQEYLVDGLTDELTTSLAQGTALRVISRTSTMQYKGVKKPLPEIASALHVDAVVEGSVLRSGKTVRVTAQLVDARRDQHLWAHTYDESADEPLAGQDKVIADIAMQVRKRLTNEAPVREKRPVNPQAQDLYLRGEYLWHQRTLESLTKAIDYYQQAVRLDPGFAAAYAAQGEAYVLLSSYGGPEPERPLMLARAAAGKALELDSSLGRAHTVLAAVKVDLDWDWPGAEAEFRRALQLDPSDPTTHHWYALHLARMKRFPEAEAEMDRALALDPVSVILQTDRALLAYYARKPELAAARVRQALELDGNFAAAHMVLGEIHEQTGSFPEALAEFDRAVQLFGPAANVEAMRGHVLALAGRRGEAEAVIAALQAESRRRYVSGVDIGAVYCALGQTDAAMKLFERGYKNRDKGMDVLGVDPLFDGCRKNPAFLNLLARLKLP
jgi:TolB-like protein/DNA-binding winged helix-turn-helix (wHTH) protein/Tfp pilus assembly protein PilF